MRIVVHEPETEAGVLELQKRGTIPFKRYFS